METNENYRDDYRPHMRGNRHLYAVVVKGFRVQRCSAQRETVVIGNTRGNHQLVRLGSDAGELTVARLVPMQVDEKLTSVWVA